MAWPVPQDYNEAVQDPATSFADPELRAGEAAANALGIPQPRSGNFADVYEFKCAANSKWAVKCFTRQVHGLRERYAAISQHLQQARLSFTVDFQYLEQGIRIRGQWYPILKMRWVEGLTLNEFVRDALDKPALLDALGQIWTRMAKRLREARMAHADLQHGNVLLVPGSSANALAVKLIDYDGTWVPALAASKSGEVGHPAYQHPQRLREGIYDPEVDRFPLLVVAAALRCLCVGGKSLWERYDNGDNLLFRERDLAAPRESALFADLLKLEDPLARSLVTQLAAAAHKPLGQAPLLEELLPDRPAATPAKGVTPAASTFAAQPAESTFRFADKEEPSGRRKRGKRVKKSLAPLVAGGMGLAVLLLGGGVFLATLGGGSGKPASGPSVAQNNSDKGKTGPKEALLFLAIDRPGAEVSINGKKVSVSIPGDGKPVKIKTEPGRHTLRIRKDGFEDDIREVEVKAGKAETIKVRLKPKAITGLDVELPYQIDRAIEGEGLQVLGKSSQFRVIPQDMAPFRAGKWSGNTQLWAQPRKGDWVDLALPVAADGKYRVLVYLTKARDYGIVQFFLDGTPLGSPIDCFHSPEVVRTEPIDLGTVELNQPRVTLRVEMVDTNERSTGWRYTWGLDCVVLKQASP
jgi:hypothetical protein